MVLTAHQLSHRKKKKAQHSGGWLWHPQFWKKVYWESLLWLRQLTRTRKPRGASVDEFPYSWGSGVWQMADRSLCPFLLRQLCLFYYEGSFTRGTAWCMVTCCCSSSPLKIKSKTDNIYVLCKLQILRAGRWSSLPHLLVVLCYWDTEKNLKQ